ncbi:MFS transporter [Alicyclobacillus tolerans]|uniref:MFS transporter n=1 Tax=Alicyclobacillus tolerans TaxID=90970 RepID=UPI001EFFC6F1|nr:MFS transporter [Alicyclobacillus tolerans]MCF8565745.1 MFS transporter [Alicyclobacillus tolerans]
MSLNLETKSKPSGVERSLGYSLLVVAIAFLGYTFSAMDAGMFGIALPSVAKSLHISGSAGEYILSIGMAVSVVAGLIIGPLADRFGRRKMLQVVLSFTAIFSALTAFVGNYVQLALVRALDQIGLDNVGPSNTLVAEGVSARVRGLFMGVMQAGYPVGMALAGSIAAFFLPNNWRTLFLIAFIPAIVVVLLAFFVKEPRRFKAAKAERPHKIEWAQMFEKDIRKQTWILLFYTFLINSGIGAQATYFALYVTSHNHLSAAAAAGLIGITGWIAVASQIFIGILADRIPSKYLLVILPILGSVGIFVMMGNGGYGSMFLAMTIYALFGNGIYGCLTRYMSESFPTRVRGTAITGLVAIGNINFVIIPLIGGVLLAAGVPQYVMLIVGLMMVIAGFLMIAGKVVKPGQELEIVTGEN